MWNIIKVIGVSSFTFGKYKVDKKNSTIIFNYRVKFKFGISKTFTDKLFLKDVREEDWDKVPEVILEPTLQALLLVVGINYWSVFTTKNIHIEGFSLTREQANFWNSLYLNGLAEYFYAMKIDFRDLISFPYEDKNIQTKPTRFELPKRALLLNGAGKDSILSAEILKASGVPFDFFTFSPTPAHKRIAKLVGAKIISVKRQRDFWVDTAGEYPSVSTFTFIALLLSELLGYDSILFSNEKSADFGNLEYLGLSVNHQWCKSSEAEKMVNDYIQSFITPDISTHSLLRKYSELEIVKSFVRYPQYFYNVTSCNNYFHEPRLVQLISRTNYWCNRCPKCVFIFACFSAFLPKKEVVSIFGADLYTKRRLATQFKRILGVEGFKPFDCVGESEEMILAMHYASLSKEYENEPIMELFKKYFPPTYDFDSLEKKVFQID